MGYHHHFADEHERGYLAQRSAERVHVVELLGVSLGDVKALQPVAFQHEDDINGKHREHRRREYQRQPVLPAEGAVRLHQLFQRFPADIGFQRIVVHRHEHYLNGADEHRQSDGENIGDYAGYLVGVLYGVLAYFHNGSFRRGNFNSEQNNAQNETQAIPPRSQTLVTERYCR